MYGSSTLDKFVDKHIKNLSLQRVFCQGKNNQKNKSSSIFTSAIIRLVLNYFIRHCKSNKM